MNYSFDEPWQSCEEGDAAWIAAAMMLSRRPPRSVARLQAEGFHVYERDGFGRPVFVGIDADCGMLDASCSLERLHAISALLGRRGLAGLGFGLAARTTWRPWWICGVDLGSCFVDETRQEIQGVWRVNDDPALARDLARHDRRPNE
jgi:hypothetical protein